VVGVRALGSKGKTMSGTPSSGVVARVAHREDHSLRRQRHASAPLVPRTAVVFVIAIGLVASSAKPGRAEDGNLDRRFGGDGIVLTATGEIGYGYGLAEQPDGGLIAGGQTYDRQPFFDGWAVTRYTGSGHLDPSFGDAGVVQGSFGGTQTNVLWATKVDGLGRILIGGRSYADGIGYVLAMARLQPDGRRDGSFGDRGVVLTAADGSNPFIFDLAFAPDGAIVAAGQDYPNFEYDYLVARYLEDGSLDPSFAGDGVLTLDKGGDEKVTAVDVQSDSKIVIAGTDGSLTRLNPDGSFDDGFGVHGVVQPCSCWDVQVLPDSRILTVGGAFTVARWMPDGAPDLTFGTGGSVSVDFGGSGAVAAYALALQEDESIIAAGGVGPDFATRSVAVARVDDRGRLDRTFGMGGRVVISVGNDAIAFDVVAQDYRLVTAGYASSERQSSEFLLIALRA
jgi:uncharacterized delta-60 repeat protein